MIRPEDQAARRVAARQRHNAEFVRGLLRRRPELDLDKLKEEARRELPAESPGALKAISRATPAVEASLVLETIVRKERPVLFVEDDWINDREVTANGVEALELIEAVKAQKAVLSPLMPLVGRIDVTHFPGADYVGTGWLVAPDVVVTNRHVAALIARWDGRRFAFRRGVGGSPIAATIDTLHEFDDLAFDQTRRFAVTEVLYIEPESSPCDIAFLRIARRTDGTAPTHIAVSPVDLEPDTRVLVVGYPARASSRVIPDQQLMRELFRDRYDVKRAAPGYTMLGQQGSARHDCTTLGGNSGSVVLDLRTGQAAGLHFAGLYQEANYAVPASTLNDYVSRRRWTRPPSVETAPPPAGASSASGAAGSITIPLTISFGLGGPVASLGAGAASSGPTAARVTDAMAEAAAKAFWTGRPDGVVAVRVGYPAEGDRYGDAPFIAAAVGAERLAAVAASGPQAFQGVEVRYVAASAAELLDSLGLLETVSTVAYDDDARTGPAFSFDGVDEEMTVLAHVGPEYSWDVLRDFLGSAEGPLVSAMYEFHAEHIFEAVEARLAAGAEMKLVLDDATFHGDDEEEQARLARFDGWARNHAFRRIVAPEGAAGLIANAYHIKVTVGADDTFWLSSGNWKDRSSQPVVTQAQRDRADVQDLPGNREWHVVVANETLAGRLRSHIEQDFRRCEALGGGPGPRRHEAPGLFLDIPVEEALELERPPPGRVLAPRQFAGRRKVKLLLTPDREGAVYAEAVLELIRSARESLLFQIPYIAMPSNPTEDRGYIDDLIRALTQKLKALDDARLLLRSGGSKHSSPAHVAWYFKAKGVDIANRLRVIDNHHTKGMIVDDAAVLIGSHNWSRPGVSLNRDASLIFSDVEIAAYYKEAFEIDWARARPINPKRFVRPETGAFLETADDAPPREGYRRLSLAELLKEDD